MPSHRKGFFITVEGPEGSGKTTIARKLYHRIRKLGQSVVFTLEPGGTPITAKIRALLLQPTRHKLGPLSELFLFEADRAEHVASVIRPALKEGKIVLCVRYDDSTTAYQGYGRGLDIPMVKAMNHVASGGLKPDITLLIDVPTKLGLKRAKKITGRLDRIEKEKVTFHRKLRQGFLAIAKQEPKRFVVISGDETIKQVEAMAWQALSKPLAKKGLKKLG